MPNNIGEHTMSGIFKSFQSTTVQTLTSVGSAFNMINDGITMAANVIERHKHSQLVNKQADIDTLVTNHRKELVATVQQTYKEVLDLKEKEQNTFNMALELLQFDELLRIKA
jgi:hypothetical protein